METTRYKVAVNHEEQYALWMSNKENAAGWKDTGIAGTKSECLDYIRAVWTDMRPLSLRKVMANGNMFNRDHSVSRLCHAA